MSFLKNIPFLPLLLLLLLCQVTVRGEINVVNTHGVLTVNGNRITDEHGEVVSFAGVSLFWSNELWGGERFYSANTVHYLSEEWGATIVRAAMGVEKVGGWLEKQEVARERLDTVVKAAIEEGIYVIIDWHSHHAEDFGEEAIRFFTEVASKYGEFPNVIYEIYNEPLNTTSWEEDIKPYAEPVIAAIRAIDPDNLIVVGTPTWSQDVDIASLNPISGYNNIAYTLHFYAGTHKEELREKAEIALENGIALMVTEWGTVNATGDGTVDKESTREWIKFMRDNNLSHCNWAFNDKNEGASILKPNSDNHAESWPNASLTESGLLVKEIVKGWPVPKN